METAFCNQKVEIWGGIECSINRVSNSFQDQCLYSGHYTRPNDIGNIAKLGIKKMRYPVLWEKHKPGIATEIDWKFCEKSLNELKKNDIEPIVGLVHHGSGPEYVSFFNDTFANQSASYARQVAEKFPWITLYTPINEPLTTARFCGLYGLWYPHGKSDYEFLTILLSECKATILAMKAIREINPEAKLVQTEDLGKTHSTPLLKYQVDFENERRWLAIDLLCGKVNPAHQLWQYFIRSGIPDSELYFFIDNPCPPDILGFNYYLTSERYIDETLELYPAHTHGGNNKHKYADVEAVRVPIKQDGVENLLIEAWNRFKLPLAITEVHLGCTREEQLRWVNHVWNVVNKLNNEAVDIRALTVWSLLGSYNWCNLLTSNSGTYESGAFDVRSGELRPTALSGLIRSLSKNTSFSHPVLEIEGWWNRDSRILYANNVPSRNTKTMTLKASKPILIIGKTGTLGNAFARICESRAIYAHGLSRKDLNICNEHEIEKVILQLKPWAIVNAAGFVRVDDAENDADSCFQTNAIGPENLAKACLKYGIKLLTFSSDMVFDGTKNNTYVENDGVAPLNVYGQSKVMAEQLTLATNPEVLVVRTSAFFGPWDMYNFVYGALRSFRNNQRYMAASNIFISPTYVPDLVNTSLDLLLDNASGVWHLANSGETSWASLAEEIARRGGYSLSLTQPVSSEDLNWIAKRPQYSAIKSEKGIVLPSLDDALSRFFNDQKVIAV